MLTQVDLLKKYGLSIRGHLGQHLLIDPNIQRKIVGLLELEPLDRVLEIGPGLGALTGPILERGSYFTAIETDEKFVRILKEEFPQFSEKQNRLIHGDILKFDFKALKAKPGKEKWKVISNLPYYITAPIVFHLLESRKLFSKFVFTMQKEVADRLLASPGSKDYGRLTLAMRYAGTVRHAFDVPRTCFTPQPAVGSSVVVMELYPDSKLLKGEAEKRLFELIRLAFSQRRKMFINLLAEDEKVQKSREELQELFETLGISAAARGEALLLKDYVALTQKLMPSRRKRK